MSKLMLFRLFLIMFLTVCFLVSHKMESQSEMIIMLFTCMMTGAYVVAEVAVSSESKEDQYIHLIKLKRMKKLIVLAVLVSVVVSSCRTITVQQAANGRAKCGKWLR